MRNFRRVSWHLMRVSLPWSRPRMISMAVSTRARSSKTENIENAFEYAGIFLMRSTPKIAREALKARTAIGYNQGDEYIEIRTDSL